MNKGNIIISIILIVILIGIIYFGYTYYAQIDLTGKSKEIWDTLLTHGEDIELDLMPEWKYLGKYKCWYLFKILDDRNDNARVFLNTGCVFLQTGDYCFTTCLNPKSDFWKMGYTNEQKAWDTMIQWADVSHKVC